MRLCNRHVGDDGTLGKCLVQTRLVGTRILKSSQNTRLPDGYAGLHTAGKNKNPLSGAVCLLTRGDLISVRVPPSRFACRVLPQSLAKGSTICVSWVMVVSLRWLYGLFLSHLS
jgi:hypothetical protein